MESKNKPRKYNDLLDVSIYDTVRCMTSNDHAEYQVTAIDAYSQKMRLSGARANEWHGIDKIRLIKSAHSECISETKAIEAFCGQCDCMWMDGGCPGYYANEQYCSIGAAYKFLGALRQ